MEHFNDLMNRWQDTCYPGQGRPFTVHQYVSEDMIWLSDSRQGGHNVKTSRERMESQIALQLILDAEEAKRKESCDLLRVYKAKLTALDEATRRELTSKLNGIDHEVKELRDQCDTIAEKLAALP